MASPARAKANNIQPVDIDTMKREALAAKNAEDDAEDGELVDGVRLEAERIREQRQHRPEVRERVEEVGAARRMRAPEPGLQERSRRRQEQEGKSDVGGQREQDPRRRVRADLRPPELARGYPTSSR